MVRALSRVFRWRTLLDTGVHATIEDLAKSNRIGKSYVRKIIRLTLLAPDVVEAILDGRQPVEVGLDDLLEGFPLEWVAQRTTLQNV
jgi:hypothetical protein